MDFSVFDAIELALPQGPEAALDCLAERARSAGDYHTFFGARMMSVRHRLGLPLLNSELRLKPEQRGPYEAVFREAAREAGEFFLAAGDIPSAWQYFKAISEPEPVACAIDALGAPEDPNRIIEIAYHDGVSRKKGFELCLKHHGICTAITWFGENPDPESRQQCLALLVRTLYEHVAEALKETIAANEGTVPADTSIAQLIAERDWLFEGTSSYVDSTHLTSVLRYAPELRDLEMIRWAIELADYGQHLHPMFHFRGDPPFEDTYRDHAAFLRALAGEQTEAQIEHFRGKIRSSGDTIPARVLIELLVRLGRHREALEAALEYLPPESDRANFALAVELCELAGDFKKLRHVARHRNDPLTFAAGWIEDRQTPTVKNGE